MIVRMNMGNGQFRLVFIDNKKLAAILEKQGA